MKRAKEIGMNYINAANQVCPIEMFEAADELGIILQCGESKTVTVEFNPKYLKGGQPVFELSGWNTKVETIDRTENRQ